jgi:hypothetical protein
VVFHSLIISFVAQNQRIMNNYSLNTILVVALIATLQACSKDEAFVKSSDVMETGVVTKTCPDTGEIRSKFEILYSIVNDNYLLGTKPIDLDQYKDGTLLDSVSDGNISLVFNSQGRKNDKTSTHWGYKPHVVDEFAPTINFKDGSVLVIKLSKKVLTFGIEFNTPYKGIGYGITSTYFDKSSPVWLNGGFTVYLNSAPDGNPALLGYPGGSLLWAIKNKKPFDRIEIGIGSAFGKPAIPGTFEYSIAGIRYALAK